MTVNKSHPWQEWSHSFRLPFLRGLPSLRSAWDNALMTFSHAPISKAQRLWERRLLPDENSCEAQWHFGEGQVGSHPISRFLGLRREKHCGLTRATQQLCPGYMWAIPVGHLFSSHLFLPSYTAWQCLWNLVAVMNTERKKKKKSEKKSNSRRILLLRERHYNLSLGNYWPT